MVIPPDNDPSSTKNQMESIINYTRKVEREQRIDRGELDE